MGRSPEQVLKAFLVMGTFWNRLLTECGLAAIFFGASITAGGWVLTESPTTAQQLPSSARYCQQAQKLLQAKRFQEAHAAAQHALEIDPRSSEAQSLLGMAELALGNLDAAAKHLSKAVELKPSDPKLLAALLQAQLQLKQETAAAATLAKLDGQLDTKDPRRMELAARLANAGEYRLASQQFERLRQTQPESYELNYNLALAYHRAREENRAAAVLAGMLKQKESAEIENLLGDVEEARGNKSPSLEAFHRAAELEPRNEEYRYDYAQALAHWAMLDQALDAFSTAARDLPGSTRLLLAQGATYYLAGRYSEAAATLLRAAGAVPEDPSVYYLLGRVYDAAGPLQNDIVQRFANYVPRQPRDAWAEYFYGRILAQRAQASPQEGAGEAEQHLERAIALDGRLAEAHAELGRVLAQRRQLAAAQRELERAVELDPKASSALYQLADVYRKSGQPEKAQRTLAQFQRVKAQEKADKDREAVEGFLERAK